MVKLLLDVFGGDARAKSTYRAGDLHSGPRNEIECYHVNCRVSSSADEIGHFRWSKVLLLLKYCGEALWCRFRFRVANFYYIPANGNRPPVYRDWIVMLFCRPFFKRRVYHWQASGLGDWLTGSAAPWERRITHKLVGQPDLSIVLGEFTRQDGSDLGSKRVEVVPNSIPDPCPQFATEVRPRRLARAAARRKLMAGLPLTADDLKETGSDPHIFHVLFLSLCYRQKGLFDLIEAVALANRQLTAEGSALRIKLFVAGRFYQDAERAEFEERIRQPDFAHNERPVQYFGFVVGEAKYRLFSQSDCFCLPTYYPVEAHPVSLIEAMAFGLPVITTNWRMMPEVLPRDYPGIVQPRAPEQIAAVLKAFLQHEFTDDLRAHFLNNYTHVQFRERMTNALQPLENVQPARFPARRVRGAPSKLRIIQVFNNYVLPGGEEKSVARIAADLEKAGHHVTRFWRSSAEWISPKAPPRYQQFFLLWRNRSVLTELQAIHRREQADLWILHNVVPVVSLRVYRLARELNVPIIQWLHNYRPFSPSGALSAGNAFLKPNDPFLAWKETWSGSWNGRFLTGALAVGYAWLRFRRHFSSVRAWIPVSEEMKRIFVQAGWPGSQLHTIRHSWNIASEFERGNDAGYFLFLGRMVEAKGVRFLIELWQDPALKSVQLVMAGQGPLADELRGRKCPSNVTWIGHVEGAEKKKWLTSCRAVLFPSTWAEPLSTVAYEAYEAGKPIVVSERGGMKEIVFGGETGFILDAANHTRWRETILQLANDASLAKRLGIHGRQWLEAHVGSAIWNKQFDAVIQTVLAP